ncbi:MAG: putative DNA-binding domain-containing protein, partial [Gammaproteobacteria bacterium]|nr:putative DNA-binding domain-containing protein [Gammaproteobacteria bacterium]
MLQQLQDRVYAALIEGKMPDNLFAGTPLQVQRGLETYRDSIIEGRIAALSRLYARSKQLLNDDIAWQQLLTSFCHSFPSEHTDITQSGAYLANFILHYPAIKVVWLADFVRLEWARHLCFHAAKSEPIQALSQLPEMIELYSAKLPLELASGTILLSSPYPLATLWHANSVTEDSAKAGDIGYFILYREHASIAMKQLTAAAWHICQALMQQRSLLALCECLEQQAIALDNDALGEL